MTLYRESSMLVELDGLGELNNQTPNIACSWMFGSIGTLRNRDGIIAMSVSGGGGEKHTQSPEMEFSSLCPLAEFVVYDDRTRGRWILRNRHFYFDARWSLSRLQSAKPWAANYGRRASGDIVGVEPTAVSPEVSLNLHFRVDIIWSPAWTNAPLWLETTIFRSQCAPFRTAWLAT